MGLHLDKNTTGMSHASATYELSLGARLGPLALAVAG